MKKILYFVSTLLFTLTSCEKLDGKDRFEPSGLEVGNKMILVEDFTGQKCVNCPSAATFLSELNEGLGDKLIIVSMHAGGFATGTPLYNETAQKYMTSLNLVNNPAVSVDRTFNSDKQYQDWAEPLSKRATLNAVCGINTVLNYDEANKTVSASSEITFAEDVNEKLGVQYYVLCDGIVNYQMSHEGFSADYVHNHVFSGTMYSDIWGAELPGESGEKYLKAGVYKAVDTPKFDLTKINGKVEDVSVVTFVFRYSGNAESPIGEVLQASKVKLIN